MCQRPEAHHMVKISEFPVLLVLTWRPLGAPHSHAAAVLSDAVVCDLGDHFRVGLQVEQKDVVWLQVTVDDHGRVQVSEEDTHRD